MSIDDDIKALREKYPDLLQEFSDNDLAGEGFLLVPESELETYAKIKSDYRKLPKSVREEQRAIQRARATLEPSIYPAKEYKPPEEPSAPKPPKSAKVDYNINDYMPTPAFDLNTAQMFDKARETIKRAERGDKSIAASDIEAAQSILFNDRQGVNRSNFLMKEEDAEEILETPGFMSPLGILEPFDYPRGTSWATLAYLGDYLPETDTWIGQQLQDAAGYAGGLTTDLTTASPLLGGLGVALTEDVGFGELAGRNLYEAASSGKLADAVTRFHGDGIAYVDTGYRLPNLTGPQVLDIVLPKEDMAKLRDKAKAQGATEAQIEMLDKLATSDTARTIAGIIPEFVVDPLIFAGPAKFGQVIEKGGKAIRVGSMLGEASQAVAKATGGKADDIMRLGVDVVDGNAEALSTFRDTANKLEASVQAKNREADALIAASKASPENQVRAATEELTKQMEDVGATAEPIRTMLIKSIEDAATPQAKEAAELALQVFDQKMVRVVDDLAKTRATLGMERDFAVNAEKYLKDRAKSLRGVAARNNADAESIKRFIKVAEEGGGTLGNQAVINRGLNFHIPLTQKQAGVSLPFFGKEKGIRLKPLQGDTAASISAWTGVNVPDLAKLNNTTVEGLEEMIRNGEKIVYQIGNKPSHMGKFVGLSLLPEGVVTAYLRGLTPTPIAENLGNFQRYFSGNNYQRILELEKTQPLSAADTLSKYIYEYAARPITASVDKFMQLFATRFTQPLLASERLSKAMRFFENRDVKTVRNNLNSANNAILRLKTVAPDIWNAYQDATTKYLRAATADTDRINAFMARMMRQANEIAAARTAQGIETDGEQIMQEVMNAIESGQGQTLSKEELDIAGQITQLIKQVGDENNVEREAVRQSLLAMVRWVQSDPQTIADVIEEVRHLELLLAEMTKRGVEQTDENLAKLNEILTKIKASKPKKGTSEAASKKRLRELTRQAIKDIKEIQRRLKKGESIEDIEILQRQVEPVAKPEPAAVPEPEPAAVPEPEVAAVPEPAPVERAPQGPSSYYEDGRFVIRQGPDEPLYTTMYEDTSFHDRVHSIPFDEIDLDGVVILNTGKERKVSDFLSLDEKGGVLDLYRSKQAILRARVKSPPKSWKDILKVLNEGGYIRDENLSDYGPNRYFLHNKDGKTLRKVTQPIYEQLQEAQLTRYDEIAERRIINTDQYRKNFRKQTAYQKLFEFLDQGFVTKPGKRTWSIIDPSTSKEVGKIKNSLMQDLIDVNIIRDKGDETYELAEDYRKVAQEPEPAPAPEPAAAPTPAPDVPQAAIPEGFDLENLPPLTEDPALLKKLAKLPKSWQKAIDQLVEGGELIDDSLTTYKYVRVVSLNKSNNRISKFNRTVSNITKNTLKQLVDTGIIRKYGPDDYILDPYNYFKSLLLRPKAKELVETLLDGGSLQSSKKIDDMFDTDLERALVGNTFVRRTPGQEVYNVVDNLGNEILTVPDDQYLDLLDEGRFTTEFTANPKSLGGNPNTPDTVGSIIVKRTLDTTPILKSKTNNFKDLKLVDKAGKTVNLETRKFVEELLNIGALKYLPEGNAGKGSFELAPDFMALRSRPAPEAPKQAAPPPAQPKAVEPEPAAPAPKAAEEVVEVFDDTAQQAEILGAAKKGVLEIQDDILKLTEEIARRGDAPPRPKITPPEFKTPRGTSTSAMVRPLLNWEMDLFKQYRGIIDEANARRKAAGLDDMSEEAELRSMMAVFQDAPNALKRPEAFREATERYVTGTNPSNARLDVLPADKGQRFEELNQQIDEILVKTPAQRTADDKARLKALRAQQDALYFEQWQISGGFTPQFVGERFGALPEDIQDITESMSQMFQQYEKLYKEYGRDFTKDPFERMKLWGVVGYVPHMRKDFKNPINEQLSFERFSRGGLDREMSLTLDQAKERKIQGLIAEINALPKGNTEQNWTFSVDPNLLIAHFVSGAKSLNNQDYLVALLKGGVIRTFDNIDQAAREQYIPLFDRGEYARDMQILILGTRGDISTLINNKTGNPQDYINEFRAALGAAIKNNRRIGEPETRPFKVWTDDIAEIRKTDTVEQALAGVNLHATIRNEDTFNAAERHKELVEAIMDERRTKLENLLVKKNELLDAASKDENIAKYTEQIAALQLKLVETATDTQRARRKAERAAWEQVATEVNARVAKANNEREINLQVFSATGRLPNVSGKGLAMYMAKDQEMFRLYIPATVQESMSRTLEFTEVSKRLGLFKKASDSLNNFWKARITVLSLAFTARNWVGNLFSNALNVGVGGAMDLSTNYKACLIGSLVDYHAKYGSIDNALFEMSKPENFKRAFLEDKGMDSQFMRLRERADLTALLRGLGVTDGKGLIDLGDGVMRPLDDVLADLTNRGVISGQSTYRVDSDEIAYQYQKLAAEMGVKESTGKTINVKWSKAKTWLSGAEDTMYIGLPFIMGAPFVGMPKWLGQTIARRTENQGRMVNYIANLKQGRTSDEAAEMVNKFLFDYSDLTNTQKTWMRSLFPFFTWNQKNILLHMELMQTNPTYYADMYRFFYGALPDISAAMEQDKAAAEGLDIADYDARNRAYEKIRTGPKYRAFRVAVDVDPTNNIVIQGFGLPIEGFAQNVGTANDIMNNTFKTFAALTPLGNSKGRTADIINGLGTYGSQTNLALRAFIELGFDYDLFRQESITEGNYDYKQKYMLANDFGNLVQVLSQYSNPAVRPGEIETASTQGTGHLIAKYIIDQLDMVPVHNEKDGKMNWYVQNPEKIKALRAMRMLPYERLLREAATAIDLNQTMYMTPEVYESGRATNFLDNRNAKMYRFLSAYTGLKLKQDTDILVQEDIFEETVKQLMMDYHSSMIPGAKK